MVLKKQLVEVPLFVGMGEGQDAQNRQGKAVVSENVSFDKSGAVESRPGQNLKFVGATGLNSRLVPSIESVLITSGTTLHHIVDDERVGISLFVQGLENDTTRIPVVSDSAAWVRCVEQDGGRLVYWQQPNKTNTKYTGRVAFVATPSLTISPIEDLTDITLPGSNLVRVDGTTAVSVEMKNNLVSFTKLTTTGSDVLVGTNIATNPSTNDVVHLSSVLHDGQVFVLASVLDATVPGYPDLYLIELDPSAMTVTATTHLTAIDTNYRQSPYASLISTSAGDLVGVFNGTSGLGISFAVMDPAPTGAPTTISTGYSPTAPYGANAWNLSDSTVIEANGQLHIATRGAESITVLGVDNSTYAIEYLVDIPGNLSLLSDPWYNAGSGTIEVPLVWSDAWLAQLDSRFGLDWQPMTDEAPLELASAPLYTIGLIVSVNPSTEEVLAHSFFGEDEVTNHSNLSAGNTSLDEIHHRVLGTLLPGQEIVHCRQVEPRSVGWDSLGQPTAAISREGYGCSMHSTVFGDSKKLTTSFGNGYEVIPNDLVSVVQGGRVQATGIPIPPKIELDIGPIYSGATSFARSFAACWCIVNADGSRWRGPVSHVVVGGFNSWDFAADDFDINYDGIPPIAGVDHLVLEVYASQMEAGVPSDVLQLAYSVDYSPGDPGGTITVKQAETTEPNPIVYTFGGELPNEVAVAKSSLSTAAGRIWTIDGARALYSKKRGYKKGLAFNGNLYVDSPDGSDFVAVATLDEQAVLLTREGIYLARGQGPNDLGTGNAIILARISSETGCVSGNATLSFQDGVLFRGERGMYLLGRDMSCVFVGGDIEDSLDAAGAVDFAYYDRDRQEACLSAGGRVFCFHTPSKQWTVLDVNSGDYDHIVAYPDKVLGTYQSRIISFGQESEDNDYLSARERPPMVHSTPWMSVNTQQGYQRAYRFKVRGKADLGDKWVPADFTDPENPIDGYLEPETRTKVTFKVYVDHEPEPSHVVVKDLRQVSQLDPLELNIPVGERQKCESIRLQIETEQSSMWLRLTSIVLEIGVKRGSGARPNLSPS